MEREGYGKHQNHIEMYCYKMLHISTLYVIESAFVTWSIIPTNPNNTPTDQRWFEPETKIRKHE